MLRLCINKNNRKYLIYSLFINRVESYQIIKIIVLNAVSCGAAWLYIRPVSVELSEHLPVVTVVAIYSNILALIIRCYNIVAVNK